MEERRRCQSESSPPNLHRCAGSLPGEQVHVVGHAGQALALPDQLVLLLLPLLHLRVQVRGQQPQLQAQLGDAGLLLVEDSRRQEPALAALSFLCSTLDTILLPGGPGKKTKNHPN